MTRLNQYARLLNAHEPVQRSGAILEALKINEGPEARWLSGRSDALARVMAEREREATDERL